jgi:hypothetical protein
MRTVKPSGDFLVKVVADGHEAHAKVSDFAKGAGLAQLATDAAGKAIIFPRKYRIEDFLLSVEQLVRDGSADVSVVFQRAVDFVATLGTTAQIIFPAGVFRLDAAVIWKSKVGVVGAGRLETVFKPNGAFSALRGGFLSAGAYYEDCYFSDFTVDGTLQPVGSFDYSIKGIYIQRMRRCEWHRVGVVNTHATGFGVDFLEKSMLVDCYAENCGRGNTTDRFSAGAGFGFAVGLSATEEIYLRNCRSIGNRTHGFYIEYSPSNGATHNPVGISLVGCTATGNWIGAFDAGGRALQIVGGSYSGNLLAGVCIGQNGASNAAGRQGNISAALITDNGQADYIYAEYHGDLVKNASGGVVFLDTAGDVEYTITGSSLLRNIGAGIAANSPARLKIDSNQIHDNSGGGVSVKTYTEVKNLAITNNRIARNGQGALYSVDGIAIDAPTLNLMIANNQILDDQGSPTQTKAIALRGLHTSTGVVIKDNDLRAAAGSGPVRIEQTAAGAVNSNYTDGSTGVSTTITNLFTNPSFEVATSGTAGSNCTTSRPSGMSPYTGSYVFRATCTSSSLAQATLAAITVTPGEVLTFTAWLRCNAGRLVRLAFKDNANSDYWTGLPREADGNWQHHSFTFVVPAGVTSIRPSFWRNAGNGAANGDILDIDATMLVSGRNVFDYFDGATNGGAWTGTANASTSTKSITV